MATDEVVEEIELHQETIASDTSSPLQLIREKELEISGRMLSAKREADEIVTVARRRAAELIAAAEHEGGTGARETEADIMQAASAQAEELRRTSAEQAKAIADAIESRKEKAIDLVVQSVTAR